MLEWRIFLCSPESNCDFLKLNSSELICRHKSMNMQRSIFLSFFDTWKAKRSISFRFSILSIIIYTLHARKALSIYQTKCFPLKASEENVNKKIQLGKNVSYDDHIIYLPWIFEPSSNRYRMNCYSNAPQPVHAKDNSVQSNILRIANDIHI